MTVRSLVVRLGKGTTTASDSLKKISGSELGGSGQNEALKRLFGEHCVTGATNQCANCSPLSCTTRVPCLSMTRAIGQRATAARFATISSGLYRVLAIAVLVEVETYLKSDHFIGDGSKYQNPLRAR
jgi:hypothetical protein